MSLHAFLVWCAEQNIYIDDRLDIREKDNVVAVYAKYAYIPSGITLVRIPKSAILSVRTCSLAKYIPHEPYGHDAHLALSLAVLGEILQGVQSRWHRYLQFMPRHTVPIALFWGSDPCDEDGVQAQTWIKGTEVEKELQGENGLGLLLEEVDQYFLNVAQPVLSRVAGAKLMIAKSEVTLENFHYAYSLVSSRSFLIDAYHGVAMIPVADTFNHSPTNSVHLECDHDVCPTCGSLSECTHDRESAAIDNAPTNGEAATFLSDSCVIGCTDTTASRLPRVRPIAQGGEGQNLERPLQHSEAKIATEVLRVEEQDTCDMVSNLPIAPTSEVFNTYGEDLSNSELLARYGFLLDGNEHDVISWTPEELSREMRSEHDDDTELLMTALGKVAGASVSVSLADSALVYDPFTAQSTRLKQMGESILLRINSEGKISYHLWLYCALFQLMSSSPGVLIDRGIDDVMVLVDEIMSAQLALEMSAGDNDEEDGGDADGTSGRTDVSAIPYLGAVSQHGGRIGAYGPGVQAAVRQVALTVIKICKGKMGDAVLSVKELGEMLDVTPKGMVKSQMGMTQTLGERSVLESCAAAWTEVVVSSRLLGHCLFEDDGV